jgi:hypothetical protein
MGVSETYWTPDVLGSSASSLVEQMLNLRSQMLWNYQQFVGVRIAIEGSRRRSTLLLPGRAFWPDAGVFITIPIQGTRSGLTESTRADQLRAVIQDRWLFANDRATTRYLAGVPDAATVTEPATLDMNDATSWWKAHSNFTAFLTGSGFQIRAQQLPPQISVYNVVGVVQQQAAPGLIGIQISTTAAPPIVKGGKIALQGMRAAKGTRGSTMNGTWYVDSVDTTQATTFSTVYLRNSQGIDPEAQRFTDKTILRPVVYSLYPIQQIVSQRAGIHKRGRPSIAPRGRRLTRPSLDP